MKQRKQVTCLKPALLLALSVVTIQAQVTVTNQFSGVNKVIPDGSAMGIADTRRIIAPGISTITDLQVQLTIEGGVNGDLYCYLVHDTGFVVLVNRPGRSAENPVGYEDGGFNATFTSQATNDFHCYQECTGPSFKAVSGSACVSSVVCAPDGRETDPNRTTESSPRTKGLASFAGLNPNGQWTLFVADLSSGAQGTLKNWGLVITGTADPARELHFAKAPPVAAKEFPTPIFAHYTPTLLP
jgi:subtilisin-like proprotein convertase family protein